MWSGVNVSSACCSQGLVNVSSAAVVRGWLM